MIDKLCDEILKENDLRKNLIELNRMIKNEAERDDFLDVYYEHESFFIQLLDHEDAKVRKNVIKLLSVVADQTLFEVLFEHYQKEETQFLKQDYVNAFDAFDYAERLKDMKQRMQMLAQGEQTKHSIEEYKQLRKLVWKLEPPKKHVFNDYDSAYKVLLVTAKGHEAVLYDQICELDPVSVKQISGGCDVQTSNLKALCRLRTWQAMLFDFLPTMIRETDGRKIGEMILNRGHLVQFLQKCHEGRAPFVFRVEVKGVKDAATKNGLAGSISKVLEQESSGMLINETSCYEIEIRVIVTAKGCRVLLKLLTLQDDRFSYRKYVTSTSMKPVRAALLLEYAKPYLSEYGNVLDPFCGTGTLLIERGKLMPYRALYGIDISEQAIQSAWQNSQAAEMTLQLIHRNMKDFTHEYKFTEIITDLPKSGEAMNGQQIRMLHHQLFGQAFRLLEIDGVMVIYTDSQVAMIQELAQTEWIEQLLCRQISKENDTWLYVLKRII